MLKHTTTPWATGGTLMPGAPNETVWVWGPTPTGAQSGEVVARDVRPANAALIVHRVNVHDELLASLERTNALLVHLMKTVPWGKTSNVDFGELNDVLCALPGVIAKAKRGS